MHTVLIYSSNDYHLYKKLSWVNANIFSFIILFTVKYMFLSFIIHSLSQSGAKLSDRSPRRCKVITYDRDVICLTKDFGRKSVTVKIPRLCKHGLKGQICFMSSKTEEDTIDDIRSVFKCPLRNQDFSFANRWWKVPNSPHSITIFVLCMDSECHWWQLKITHSYPGTLKLRRLRFQQAL